MFKLMYRTFLIGRPCVYSVVFDLDGCSEYELRDYEETIGMSLEYHIKIDPNKGISMCYSQHRNIRPVYGIDGNTIGYVRQ